MICSSTRAYLVWSIFLIGSYNYVDMICSSTRAWYTYRNPLFTLPYCYTFHIGTNYTSIFSSIDKQAHTIRQKLTVLTSLAKKYRRQVAAYSPLEIQGCYGYLGVFHSRWSNYPLTSHSSYRMHLPSLLHLVKYTRSIQWPLEHWWWVTGDMFICLPYLHYWP